MVVICFLKKNPSSFEKNWLWGGVVVKNALLGSNVFVTSDNEH